MQIEKPYQKDLGHLSWDQVFARQVSRADLMNEWMDSLRLKPGDRVLDVGAGPGFVSLALADRVGPTGLVYALDRSADALTHLARLQRERGVEHIQGIVADAAALYPTSVRPDAALVTMVLHHAEHPFAILQSVALCMLPGAPVVIGEFHPDGPCTAGPPREERIAPEKLRGWCREARFTVLDYRRQTPEHYMLAARRGARHA